MSAGNGGEPGREQDQWSQPADFGQPGSDAPQPPPSTGPDSWSTTWADPAMPPSQSTPPAQSQPAAYPSTGPDSWSTTWADPASPAQPASPGQPAAAGSADWTAQQPARNGLGPAGVESPAPAGGYSPSGQYPPADSAYQQPGSPYQQPGSPYQQPGSPYQQPGSPYQQPASPYQQPGWQYSPPMGPYYPTAAPPGNNSLAIAALVCGIAQFLGGLLLVGNILGAIPAIICGAMALRQIERRGGTGRGMAIAGLVLGILGVVYFVIIVVLIIIGMHVHPT